ncbi:MAG: ABC transporter ATP-binding protein [Tissierella sp.]|nr:ABC transporter ATP-binding protein [Tissierella sp.]
MKVNDILKIEDITVEFILDSGNLRALNKVSLDVKQGEIIGLVGESGSGKTTLTSSILNIVSRPGKIMNGEIWYGNKNILELDINRLNQFRWKEVSMVFQAAQNAMNPILTIQDHFIETVAAHEKNYSEEEVANKAAKLLGYVRLNPERVLKSYPHELSGGMRQRAIIALSLITDPKILILDEPTTALDVITQAYIFEILKELHKKLNLTMIMSTHDVSVVGSMADRIAVMYAGEIVEITDVFTIFNNPHHPYTRGLIMATPSLTDDLNNRKAIKGNPPNLMELPKGCNFAPRCEYCIAKCLDTKPEATMINENHMVRCHNYEEVIARGHITKS